VTVAYMWLVGRHLLPGGAEAPAASRDDTLDDLWDRFGLAGKGNRLRVSEASSLVGRTVGRSGIGSRFGLRLIGIERAAPRGRAEFLPAPGPDAEIHAGDVLLLVGDGPGAGALAEAERLEVLEAERPSNTAWKQELGLAVVLVHPESRLLGRALREAGFRTEHTLHVLGLRRKGARVEEFVDEPLEAGDSLLVVGAWDGIARLQSETHDFVVLTLPREMDEVAPARRRAPVALAIVAAMVLLSALEVVPVVVAVLMAALAAVYARCLSMEAGYRSIHWSSLVLIAGMLPVADALQNTGGVDLLVDVLLGGFGEAGPYKMMTVLFFLTASLGLVLSNTATAVLMAPIAVRAAQVLEVSPYPLAMAVAIAASAAFVTPVSTPVVTLVVAPGNYRFMDFVKVGLPLLILCWLTTLLVTPIFFPF